MARSLRAARLKVRVVDGQPESPRIFCGTRDCGTSVAILSGVLPDVEHPHEHVVDWLDGFRRGRDGSVALTRRACRRWDEARRDGIPWSRFVAQGGLRDRHPYDPVKHSGMPAELKPLYAERRAALPSALGPGTALGVRTERTQGPVTFTCPVCREPGHLGVPRWWWDSERCPFCQPVVPAADGDHAFEIPT